MNLNKVSYKLQRIKNKKEAHLRIAHLLPKILEQPYFPSLDGFRALSIIIVILFHVLMSYDIGVDFSGLANLGVQFFFVISGFLITTLLIKEREKKGKISLKNFYLRRVFRIFPVAYLFLLFIILLNLVLPIKLNPIYIVASLLFVRNYYMGSRNVDQLTTHYWSLSVEEQFYLFFPILLKRSLNLYMWFLVAIIFSGVISDIIQEFQIPGREALLRLDFAFNTVNQFQGIAVGSLTSVFLFKGIIPEDYKFKSFKIAGLVALIIILMLDTSQNNLRNILKCSSFALIVVMCLKQSNTIFYRLLNHPKVKFIGVLSFSIYIWQQPLTLNLHFFNESKLLKDISNKVPLDICITIISLFLLIAIAFLSYTFYEKKFLKLKEHFK